MSKAAPTNPGGRVQVGSPEDAFLTVWLPVVLGWCVILGGVGVNGEDAAVDIFTIALRNRELDPASPGTVFKIARGVLRRHRAVAQFKAFVGRIWNFPQAVDGGNEPMARPTDRAYGAFGKLRLADREVLLLSVVEERSDADVAEILGVSAPTLPYRVRLAGARFLALVATENGPPSDA